MGRHGTWRSTDAGATFTQTGTMTFHGAASTGSIWLGSNYDGATYRSTNDGQAWSLVPVTTTTPDRMEGMSGDVDGSLFLIMGIGDSIARSTDGGVSFTDVSAPHPTFDTALHFGSGDFVALAPGGVSMRSTDNGVTIATVTLPTTQAIKDAVVTCRGTVSPSATQERSCDRRTTVVPGTSSPRRPRHKSPSEPSTTQAPWTGST